MEGHSKKTGSGGQSDQWQETRKWPLRSNKHKMIGRQGRVGVRRIYVFIKSSDGLKGVLVGLWIMK